MPCQPRPGRGDAAVDVCEVRAGVRDVAAQVLEDAHNVEEAKSRQGDVGEVNAVSGIANTTHRFVPCTIVNQLCLPYGSHSGLEYKGLRDYELASAQGEEGEKGWHSRRPCSDAISSGTRLHRPGLRITGSVPPDLSNHRVVDSVKGSKLSYMALALQREPTVYRSLLMRLGAVVADPEPMPSRLVRGCIAMAYTACVPTGQSSHRLADTVKGGELS